MTPSNRVIVNTGAQYIRTVINVLLALYATRLILKSLGADDYGIYTLIAGVVAMLSFLTNALVITTQRYMSFHQARGETEKQKQIFNNSLILHAILSLLLIAALEIAGLFLFDGFLNIAPDRIGAAKIGYQFTILMLCCAFMAAPFRALLISHENIVYISAIDVINGVLKIIIAVAIARSDADRLIFYAALMSCVPLFDLLAFSIYDYIKYEECSTPKLKHFDKQYIYSLSSFAGWTLYSTGCIIGRTQGIAIVLNKFMGATINAAYGIALQVNGAVSFISQSLLNAMNPQIVKAEGAGNRQRVLRLSEIASKFGFLLLALLVIPLVMEMAQVLKLWLNEYPPGTVYLCQLILLTALVDQLTIGLASANQAVGNIKAYSLIVNTIKLITLPIVIVLMLLGVNYQLTMISYIVIEFICCISRLFFLKHTAGLSIRHFVQVVFKMQSIPLIVLVGLYFATRHIPFSIFSFGVRTVVISGIYFATIYFFGLCPDEKEIVNRVLKKLTRK